MGVPELKSSKMQVMTKIKSGIELLILKNFKFYLSYPKLGKYFNEKHHVSFTLTMS